MNKSIFSLVLIVAIGIPVVGTSCRAKPAMVNNWFQPELLESRSPECEKILKGARRVFNSDESIGEHYFANYVVISDHVMSREDICPSISMFKVDGKKLYLQEYSYPGCGGACDSYQVVASKYKTNKDFEKFLAKSPPRSPAYGLYKADDGSIWLYEQNDDLDLVTYKLNGDGTWTRSCAIEMRPHDLGDSKDSAIRKATVSIERLKSAVAKIYEGAGDCGTLDTAGMVAENFEKNLPVVLYRPWSMRMGGSGHSYDGYGNYDKDLGKIEKWSMTGLYERNAFKNYKRQLEKTIHVLTGFYQLKFGWGKEKSANMADSSVKSAVTVAFNFSNEAGVDDYDSNQLRSAILKNKPLKYIQSMDLGKKGAKDASSESILSAAVGRPEILRYLLSKGADPNVLNAFHKTPLMYAVQYNNLDSVKILLHAGADPNARTIIPMDNCYYSLHTSGMTPLHYAVRYASPAIIRLLLDNGAIPFLKAEGSQLTQGTSIDWFDRYNSANSKERNKNIPPEEAAKVRKWLTGCKPDPTVLAQRLVSRSEKSYREKDVGAAYKYLQLALGIQPGNERALSDMSLVAMKNGKFGRSIDAADSVIRSNSSSRLKANAWFNKGLACEKADAVNATVFYNGQYHCTGWLLYPFYKAVKLGDNPLRRAKLLSMFGDLEQAKCTVSSSSVAVSAWFGLDPDSNIYRQKQELFVLHSSATNVLPRDFAWKVRVGDGTGGKVQTITPKVEDQLDLGNKMTLTVLGVVASGPGPFKKLGYQCSALDNPHP